MKPVCPDCLTGQVTGLDDAEMAWKHYAVDIVRKHRVILDGWPVNTFNPDGASSWILQSIVKKIDDGTVTWKEASDSEIKAHLLLFVETAKTRKERSDKGTRRKKPTRASATAPLTPAEVPDDADD